MGLLVVSGRFLTKQKECKMQSKLTIKGTVSVISSDPLCKDDSSRITTHVDLTVLSILKKAVTFDHNLSH